MGVADLIREYGEITGRSPGWEKYMSVSDFIEFKKAAALVCPETNTSHHGEPVSSYNKEEYKQPQPATTPITPAVQPVIEPAINKPTTPTVNNAKPQKVTNQATTGKEESELDIFKSMGE